MEEALNKKVSLLKQKFDLLQKQKKQNKKIKLFIRILILSVFSILGILLYLQASSIDTQKIQTEALRELANIQPMLSKEMLATIENIYPVYVEEIQKQIKARHDKFANLVQIESSVFLRIAEKDIRESLQSGYVELMNRQKQHLYSEFPALRNSEKVEKAIDNIILYGGTKLQSIIAEKFNKHSNLLIHISQKLKKLEDERLKHDKYLAEKTLGVTMEIIGKKLQNIDREEK